MRENCTYRLSGGRRPALRRASFDPTAKKRGNARGAKGRRIKKTVTNSGDYDKTEVYLFDGQGTIETRNGSGTMVSPRVGGPGLPTWGTDDTGIDSPASEEVGQCV